MTHAYLHFYGKVCTSMLIIIFTCIFFSCHSSKQDTIALLPLTRQTQAINAYELIQMNRINVFVFMSPQCPLSENYASTVKNLAKKYAGEVSFYVLIPGTLYSEYEVEQFAAKYLDSVTVFIDPALQMAEHLQATITPEAFLLDSNGVILYAGAIDNWAVELGTIRQVITEQYLSDAIDAYLANTKIYPAKTQAVGCYIE